MAGYYDPFNYGPANAGPNFTGPAYGWDIPGVDQTQTGSLPQGPLAGTGVAHGPLSGQGGGFLSGLRGLLDPQYALPIAAQLIGGATPQASFAGALSMAGPAIGDMRKRTAINAYLKSQSGLNLTPEEQQLLRADPELAQSVVAGHLAPHPKQFIPLPTGEIGIGDPITGTVTSAGMIGSGGGGGNGQPPGFIFPTAKNYTDPSTGETGLVDQNGLKWVIGRPTPSSDQAQASGAAALAHKANDLLKANEQGQGGLGASIENQAMKIPILGPMVSGPKGRGYDTGKKQFMSAIRALAIQARINPDSATQGYTEDALFAAQGDTPEDIAQKVGIREQIIKNLEQRAGSFVQQQDGQPSPTPQAGAEKIPTFNTPADALAAKLPSGTPFKTPDGRTKYIP